MDTPLDKLKADPDQYFKSPSQVVNQDDLDRVDKIAILESWRQECLLRQMADEENMAGSARVATILQEITNALASFGERR